MTPLDWVVVVAGIAAIAWVNWYFFLAERRLAPAPTAKGANDGARRGREERDDADDTIDHRD